VEFSSDLCSKVKPDDQAAFKYITKFLFDKKKESAKDRLFGRLE
jgi:hypothetical protein